MNKDWQKVTLDEICVLNQLSTGNKFYFDEIEYIDISSVGTGVLLEPQKVLFKDAPSRAKRLVKNGSTILSTVRPNRRSFLYIKNPRPNIVVSTGFAVLDPLLEKISSRFLYYTVTNQSFTDYLTANAKGAAYPAVDTEIIKRAEVVIPSLPTQRRIAAILSAYDELIENNSRRIKILEEMARMIYQEWFVKFRFPGHEQAKFVESPLGMIPAGWEVKRLVEICSLTMGQSPESKFYNEVGEGLPFHQGVTDFGEHFPTTRVYCTVRNRIAKAGDILFSVRAPVGRINITDQEIIIGRGLSAICSKHNNQAFIYNQLKEKFFEEDMIGGGTIFKSVTKSDLENIKILYPEEKYIKMFESNCIAIQSQIRVLTKKNNNLRQTRDMLLPKLISGEIDVSDLDIPIEKR